MGDIGRIQQRYEVLPVPALTLGDADRWTVPAPEVTAAPDAARDAVATPDLPRS